MQTILTTPTGTRLVTLQPDENGPGGEPNETPEFDRAFYEATEEPVGSLQELLERIAEKLKG